jgi:transposase
MSGKRKYTKKTLTKKAKALQDLDSGMSMRACAAKYFVSVGTIVNWKNNKSEIVFLNSQVFLRKDLRESTATTRS